MATPAQECTAQDVAKAYRERLRTQLHDTNARGQLQALLQAFVTANEDPNNSSNFRSADADPVNVFVDLLLSKHVQSNSQLVLLLLKCLKILSRKQPNRASFGTEGARAVLLSLAPPQNSAIAGEGANVLLNICYEQDNVTLLLRTPAVRQLVNFLLDDNQDVQANAAGAIQSICYQPQGRKAVRDHEGIQSLLALLVSPNLKVVTRAAGAIHNLSSDGEAIKVIRKFGGILLLSGLLKSDNLSVCGSAAGALQNLSRELASRFIIRELDVVPPLARLLSCTDLQAQVCAAGALLNIMGPELEVPGDDDDGGAVAAVAPGAGRAAGSGGSNSASAANRRAFGRLLSSIMAASIVHECVFDAAPRLDLA